ncbi:hypothetical protein O181_066375 [Austropuccinia psidii MF-1]|uniref:Pleckstrin homology domain-containing protein n=1 Tax=Austropuccinia psidii MF-1 TaxID=1389203 RepID=A0A9Q3I523_9BASI|nr:hypothetical protein [Austropuccinia psidii MF-1]
MFPHQADNKSGFPTPFNHLVRQGYLIVLWATTWQARQKWLEKIETRQTEIPQQNTVFEMITLSEVFFTVSNRVTCAAHFDNGNRLVFGT